MRHSSYRSAFFSMLLFGLLACAHHTDARSDAEPTRTTLVVDPAIVGEANTATVHLSRASRNLEIANVVLTLDMSDMAMQRRRISLKRVTDGVYATDGLRFPMSGVWRAVVGIVSPSHTTPVTLSFTVRDK